MLIGFAGYAGSGKDTAAEAVVRELGAVRRALADPIKHAITVLNPELDREFYWNVQQQLAHYGWDPDHNPVGTPTYFAAWDALKRELPEARRLLQVFGTEVGRQLFGENVWIDQLLRFAVDHSLVVVPDVRFPNEAVAIREQGLLIHVVRPGVGPVNGHTSEGLLQAAMGDVMLLNEGTVSDFQSLVVDTLRPYVQATAEAVGTLGLNEAITERLGMIPQVENVDPCRPLVCPDCRAGKHGNCSGSWCVEHDHEAPCSCTDISH
jgi:hypothetical protein